ncbi:peptidylprolyl isomerase [Candidatus Omnitrophota bacterium]
MRRILFLICLIIVSTAITHAQEAEQKILGEVFGKPVPEDVFNYYYKTAFYLTRTGKEDRSDDDIRNEAWQNLIFTYEAKRLGYTISRDELEEELGRLMLKKEIEYGSDEYKRWVNDEFNDDVATFERRIHDLLAVNKLTKVKLDPEVTVTEDEIRVKFMRQYNNFGSEYISFKDRDEAKEFIKKVKKNPRLWKDTFDEKKALGQKGAAWINVMALDALIDLWKIPKDDAFNILEHEEGDFVVSEYYHGVAVFRLLEKRTADAKRLDDKKKEQLRSLLTRQNKRKLVMGYMDDLKERAKHRDYIQEAKDAQKKEDLKEKSTIVLKTNRGNITLKLFPDIAPLACENFISLVAKKYYNGIIFHRVIKDFMIQGGDPTGTGRAGESIWGAPFIDEFSDDLLFDRPYLLAMANSGPSSNKSQFFITTKVTPWLNRRHTIFGEVIKGSKVVDKIEGVKVDAKNKPKKEQKIIEAYIVNGK